jgi:beta-lactam-binding protein with PASTA domain
VPLRQAVRILESNGLKQGKVSYKPDIALNAVLEMSYHGKKLMPGDLVDKGSAIDLVLGDGGQTAKVAVPDLTGKTFDEALIILRGNNLIMGAVNKQNVKDSATAIIFKQKPLAGGNNVPQGEAVDIWLKDK